MTGATEPYRYRIRDLGGHAWHDDRYVVARDGALVWSGVSTVDPTHALSFFTTAVLREAPVLVFVADPAIPGTPNYAFLDLVRELPSVAHFSLFAD